MSAALRTQIPGVVDIHRQQFPGVGIGNGELEFDVVAWALQR